jgi:hypothetical protein
MPSTSARSGRSLLGLIARDATARAAEITKDLEERLEAVKAEHTA